MKEMEKVSRNMTTLCWSNITNIKTKISTIKIYADMNMSIILLLFTTDIILGKRKKNYILSIIQLLRSNP